MNSIFPSNFSLAPLAEYRMMNAMSVAFDVVVNVIVVAAAFTTIQRQNKK